MGTRWLFPGAIIGVCAAAITLAQPPGDTPSNPTPPAPAAPAHKASFKLEWFYDGNKPELLGKPAPELSVEGWVGGDAMTLASLKGKIVVIDFWGMWCPPCRAAVPHTSEIARAYKDKGVQVIGIHSKKGAEKMEQTAKQLKMGYPTAKDAHQKSEGQYHVAFWPFYVLVDREGVVRAAGLNPKHLGDALDELLKEQPAKPAA